MNTETKTPVDSATNISSEEQARIDASVIGLTRDEALLLSPQLRQRWFFLMQVRHAELKRVRSDLMQLIRPDNDIKIISIMGPTGIGKTTLATSFLPKLVELFAAERKEHEAPVIYVPAPANGEKSMSWKTLYWRILIAAGEKHIDLQRQAQVSEGEMRAVREERSSLAHIREHLEAVIRQRNVRLIVIDESLHLLRFDENAAIMDTLKSLADIHHTKLVLIGIYQITPLMVEYGQLARRTAILHYRRYATPAKCNPNKLTADQIAFKTAVGRLQALWPCVDVPQLEAVWETLMRLSLDSVGLLKSLLLQLAILQMDQKGEKFDATDMKRAAKPPKQLRVMEAETVAGEQELQGACYGDADFGSDEVTQALFAKLMGANRG